MPADNKWFTRIVVAAAVIETLDSLDLGYPKVGNTQRKELGRGQGSPGVDHSRSESDSPMVVKAIEASAQGIEVLAVAIIVVAIVHGTGRFLFHVQRRVDDAYGRFKVQLAKALLLGLEFLVAADIVRTVALEPTLHNVGILGLLVIVRTVLSWSIVVEIEGRWPWRSAGLAPGLENQE